MQKSLAKVYTIVVSGWVGVQNRVLYQVQMIFRYFDKNTLYLGKISFVVLDYCDKYILIFAIVTNPFCYVTSTFCYCNKYICMFGKIQDKVPTIVVSGWVC